MVFRDFRKRIFNHNNEKSMLTALFGAGLLYSLVPDIEITGDRN